MCLRFRIATVLVACLAVCLPAQAQDDAGDFDAWLKDHSVKELEDYLHENNLAGVLPTRQLLRTATDWRKCGGPQFEIPPRDRWPVVLHVLDLLAELKALRIVGDVQGASAYRNPVLNACANGAPRSAHTMSFAVDITSDAGVDVDRLCRFWRDEGKAWQMGLSRYPSGRIHLDVSGWRTWGADHTHKTSLCATQFTEAARPAPAPRLAAPASAPRSSPS